MKIPICLKSAPISGTALELAPERAGILSNAAVRYHAWSSARSAITIGEPNFKSLAARDEGFERGKSYVLFIDDPPNTVVLRTIPFGDHDRILHLLTKEAGKVAVFQKHARRTKGRGFILEPLDRGTVVLTHRRGKMSQIASFSPGRTLRRIRDEVDLFTLACLVTEAFDIGLPEEQPEDEHTAYPEAPALFDTLESTLVKLNDAKELRAAFRAAFECIESLLEQLGVLATKCPASSNALLRHLATLEAYAEKGILTRPLLEQTLLRLRQEATQAGNG